MTDTNDPTRGPYGEWPQQPRHPQAPQGYPQHGQQPYPPQAPHGQQPYPPQAPHAQQPPYGYPVDDAAATTVLPPVPAFDDAAATSLLPPVPAMDDPAATTLLPPVPAMDDAAATTLLPPVTASGPVPAGAPLHPGQAPGRHQAPAPQYQPPVPQHAQQQPQPPHMPQHAPPPQQQPPARARARHAAQAPQPAAAQPSAEAFDPPTMTLKRPPAPGPVGPAGPLGAAGAPPFEAVPAQPLPPVQPVPPAGPAGRTGSPIIDPGLQPALITAGAAALLAGGAALGQVALALVVALLQLLTAAGWFRLNGMWPARQGILLAALAGFTADVAVLLADSDGGVAAVVGTLGGFFLLVLVLQTFRPSDPKERFYALTVLGSATVVTALCTMLLLADWVPAGVGAVALATLLAAAPLPGPKQLGPVLGLVAAVALGLLVGAPVALGALAGLGALVGRRVAAYDFPSRFVHMTAGVALPLAVAAPLIWIATDLLA
ncbi:hypothetical protein [Kitasatospora sp. NPDC096140]|uniref:hypothetical protein n=1 Tax=Kitasatospora sp. NPDC096140 TaxID=3155425 RepID=UPI00332FDC8B